MSEAKPEVKRFKVNSISHHGEFGKTGSKLAPSPITPQSAESAHREEHYRLLDLVKLWALSRETVRLMIKDDPGVVKIAFGRKKSHTTYTVPESAARRIHSDFGGLESAFNEQHYRISELAGLWRIGRETVRLMVMNEAGVLKVRLGHKQSHTTYSVPESVVMRIHIQLC